MATKSIALFLVLVVVTCSLILNAKAAANCKLSNLGCFPSESTYNRKIVERLLKEKEEVPAAAVGSELRKVPSGPDPLHHNGNAPKKPRSDP